jgi:hypothetical protein
MALHVLAYNLTRVIAHGRDEGLAKPDKRLLNAPDQNCYASTLPASRFYTTNSIRRHWPREHAAGRRDSSKRATPKTKFNRRGARKLLSSSEQ